MYLSSPKQKQPTHHSQPLLATTTIRNHKQVTNPKPNHKPKIKSQPNHKLKPTIAEPPRTNKSQTQTHEEQKIKNKNTNIKTHEAPWREREREREREISKRELIGRRGSKDCELIGRRQVVTPSGGIEIWHICWVWIRSLGASSRLERERERVTKKR